MRRYRYKVYKWDLSGNLVTTYNGLKRTITIERVCQIRLYRAMDHGTPLRDHFWTRTPEQPIIKDGVIVNPVDSMDLEEKETTRELWEGEDGMFNIDGWRKTMMEQDFHTNKVPRMAQREVRLPVKVMRKRA